MPAPPRGASPHDPSVLASLRAAGGPLTPASPGVRVPYADCAVCTWHLLCARNRHGAGLAGSAHALRRARDFTQSDLGARHRSCACGAAPGPTPVARGHHVQLTQQPSQATAVGGTRASHAGCAVGAGAGALARTPGVAARRAVSPASRAAGLHRGLLRSSHTSGRGGGWRASLVPARGRRAQGPALTAAGFRVLRLPASLVTSNLAAALQEVSRALRC